MWRPDLWLSMHRTLSIYVHNGSYSSHLETSVYGVIPGIHGIFNIFLPSDGYSAFVETSIYGCDPGYA